MSDDLISMGQVVLLRVCQTQWRLMLVVALLLLLGAMGGQAMARILPPASVGLVACHLHADRDCAPAQVTGTAPMALLQGTLRGDGKAHLGTAGPEPVADNGNQPMLLVLASATRMSIIRTDGAIPEVDLVGQPRAPPTSA